MPALLLFPFHRQIAFRKRFARQRKTLLPFRIRQHRFGTGFPLKTAFPYLNFAHAATAAATTCWNIDAVSPRRR